MQDEQIIQAIGNRDLEHASGGWGNRGWTPAPGPDGQIWEYSADGGAKRRPYFPGRGGPPYWYEERW